MAAAQKKREKLAICSYIRKIDSEESDEVQKQRYQFKEFVKVLKSVNFFKGTKEGTDAYSKKLELARVTFNKKFPNQQIESIDILKYGYGKNKGISSLKNQTLFNSIVTKTLKIYHSFVISDTFDKYYSNIALKLSDTRIERITKESNWYTGFGNEYVKKGQKRTWKIKLMSAGNAAFFHSYIGICEINRLDAKMEGPVSDTKNIQWAMHLKTGYKCHQLRDGKPYAQRCKRGDVIQMILNMKGKGKGRLKYIINGKDYKVAFDNVNEKKCYKLAISMQKPEVLHLV
eukprot:472256_1